MDFTEYIKQHYKRAAAIIIVAITALSFTACGQTAGTDSYDQSYGETENQTAIVYDNSTGESQPEDTQADTISDIPDFDGKPYAVIDDNIPGFTKEEKSSTKTFEHYSDLDSLGRCGTAFANISRETMPTEKRGSIGMIKPSGWHTVRYDDIISDKYLYNRCHLIGFQLAGENANEKNLITGTRFMNVEGMLPFENDVADYAENTGNHVLYRVTPVFEGKNLVASGVRMEAYSVEDKGKGICFDVFCYNNQPGITIDYATGDSRRSGENPSGEASSKESSQQKKRTYIVNTNTGKFHLPDCSSIKTMKDKNKKKMKATKAELESRGYEPCGRCNP